MCVLVLLPVYICASTNYPGHGIAMVKGSERAVSGFLRTKRGLSERRGGGATALDLTPIMSGNTNLW